MELHELRLGNIVRLTQLDGWVPKDYPGYSAINTKQFECILREERSDFLFYPIPLTPEWLEKFGFDKLSTKKGYYSFEINSDDDYLYNVKNKYLYVDSGVFVSPIGRPIRHVHDLQNAIYALTGKELEIKEGAKV